MGRRKCGNIVKSLSLAPDVIDKLEETAWGLRLSQSELVTLALNVFYKVSDAMERVVAVDAAAAEPVVISDELIKELAEGSLDG